MLFLIDFDGVIADTEPVHLASVNELLRRLGVNKELSWDEWKQLSAGKGVTKVMEEIREMYGIKESLPELLREKRSIFLGMIDKARINPSYTALVQKIEEKGYKWGIVTGSDKETVRQVLKGLPAKILVSAGTTSPKPSPEPYLYARKLLDPGMNEKCIAIEDSIAGITSARHAGCYVVATNNTFPDIEFFRPDKVIRFNELDQAVIHAEKYSSYKIVFTNGVFDKLHPGHIEFLYRAKKKGDYLVVGVNTDSSAKRIGKNPLFREEHRLMLVQSIRWVDRAVLFNEETPSRTIEIHRPDLVVKGHDYKPEQVVSSNKPVEIIETQYFKEYRSSKT